MASKISRAGSFTVGIAVALAPLAQAATLSLPGSLPRTASLIQTVRLHHHIHHSHTNRHYGMISKGPGRCGENMYFSRKKGISLDARDKS
jgi:hypothetical protein